jgi:hypothetical protein
MAKNQKQEEVKTKNNISIPLSHKKTRGQKHNYTIKIHSVYKCVAAMFFFSLLDFLLIMEIQSSFKKLFVYKVHHLTKSMYFMLFMSGTPLK